MVVGYLIICKWLILDMKEWGSTEIFPPRNPLRSLPLGNYSLQYFIPPSIIPSGVNPALVTIVISVFYFARFTGPCFVSRPPFMKSTVTVGFGWRLGKRGERNGEGAVAFGQRPSKNRTLSPFNSENSPFKFWSYRKLEKPHKQNQGTQRRLQRLKPT